MSAGLSDASWSTLRVFVAVYRAGSITAAAADLGMAQASVSAQIATLEKRLGYQLFQRVRTGVIATDRGRDLAALLAGPVDALAAVTGAASGGDHPGERSVVIGGPAEFLSEVVLPGLVTELPVGVRLDARFGLADPLIEALETGQLDVLVSSVQPRRRGLRFAPVYDEHFVVVAHPRWADQAQHDIDSVPVLAYDAQLQIIRRSWRSVFDPASGRRVGAGSAGPGPSRRGGCRDDRAARIPGALVPRAGRPGATARARRRAAEHALRGHAPRRAGTRSDPRRDTPPHRRTLSRRVSAGSHRIPDGCHRVDGYHASRRVRTVGTGSTEGTR